MSEKKSHRPMERAVKRSRQNSAVGKCEKGGEFSVSGGEFSGTWRRWGKRRGPAVLAMVFFVVTSSCVFDKSGVPGGQEPELCGNGVIEGQEACDGANLNGSTCASLGYASGTLACSDGCSFDTTSCIPENCGNGTVDPLEECDGTELNGETCRNLGYSGGTLACSSTCHFDVSACDEPVCGDGIVNGSEECDDGANGDPCDGCLDDCTTIVNGCGDGFVCGNEECDDGANGDPCDGCLDDCSLGWAKRVKITADHTDIDADLSDFPILVHISAASGRTDADLSFVFDEIGNDANRKKIAVTTADGITPCHVEIEKWDNEAKEAWLWVKAPMLSSSEDTEFYFYYDSSRADNDAYVGDPDSTAAESVWDDDFVLVTHMQNDPDNQHIRDSTKNNNDGTKGAENNPHQVDGKIGFAQRWDYIGESSEYIDIPHAASLDMGDTFTAELWVDFELGNDPDNYERLLCKKSAWTSNTGWEFSLETNYDDNLTVRGSSGTGTACANNVVSSWSSGGWHHLVVVYENTTATVYRDGVERDTCVITAVNNSNNSLGIGRYGENDTSICHWYGRMDEIRLSRIRRTAAWIKANYESQRDDLLDFSVEEICFSP